MFHQPLFSEGPESFNTVNANFPLFEFIPMINVEMTVSTEHKRIKPLHLSVQTIDPRLTFFTVSFIRDSAFTSVTILTDTFPPVPGFRIQWSYDLHLDLSFLFVGLRNRIHHLQVLPSGAHLTGQDLQQEHV